MECLYDEEDTAGGMVRVSFNALKNSSSALLNNSVMTGMSPLQWPTVCCDIATNGDVRGRHLNT